MTPTIEAARAVETWWANLPREHRRAWYRPSELHRALRLCPSTLPIVMRLAGWARVTRKLTRHDAVLYVPPGATAPVFLSPHSAWLARVTQTPLPDGVEFAP